MTERKYEKRDIETEASKTRAPYPMKEYSFDNKDIPLKKNWSQSWCTFPKLMDDGPLTEILNLEVRPRDIFVVTFMKCGTTWMQEAVWLLLNNLDYETSKKVKLIDRSPYIDLHGTTPGAFNAVERCNEFADPRLIKTHMPANLLPLQLWQKKQKCIYVARNPKDAVVSSYHFVKNLNMWCGQTMEEYVEDFINNEIINTCFWTHVVDFWKMRNEDFIFFTTYEEMKADLGGVIQRLCTFLERPLLSDEELKKTVDHLDFNNMKTNNEANMKKYIKEVMPNVNENFEFLRRGIVGSFKEELTPELQCKLDKWSADFLAQHGLKEEDIFGKL